jgi:hypothetical protein
MSDAFIAFDDERRWVPWHPEKRNGRLTKVPCAADGSAVDATDPTNWMTRLEAEGCARELATGEVTTGIGIALGDPGDDTYLCGIDLDSCLDRGGVPFMITQEMRERLLGLGHTTDQIRNMTPEQANEILAPNGRLALWAAAILDVLRTYAEISPGGNGIKAFLYVPAHHVRPFLDRIGVAAGSWGTKRGIAGLSGANHGPAVEIYCSGRYFTVTGRLWSSDHPRIELVTSVQLDKLARLIPKRMTGKYRGGNREGLDNSRSGKAWRAASELHASTFGEMCAGLRDHPDPEIREWASEVDDRQFERLWDRSAGKVAAREETLAEELSAWEEQHPFPNPDDPVPGPIPKPPSAIPTGTPGVGVNLLDFYALMTQHKYIWAPARELWPAISVDARIPPIPLFDPGGNPALYKNGRHKGEPIEIAPSEWLDKHQPVEQVTWAPGEDMVVRDRLISDGGWIKRRRVSCFNLYRPPVLGRGDRRKAGRWLRHVLRVYPDKAEAWHIIRWLAHRVQHPAQKINHALVLGGEQGIGKDTIVEPVKRAVGPWNVHEESPRTVLERQFNGYLKGVILRISEACDLGEAERHTFYEHMKAIIAAPPDVLRINEKNIREYYIPNVVGVIITTNHKTDGIYLPDDDRRHYVAWSPRRRGEFSEQYFIGFYRWLDAGGDRHVAAYLASLDLSGFNPKAPPPQTHAFWDMVSANRVPEDAELADQLDLLNNPDVVTISRIINSTRDGYGNLSEFSEWLKDRRNRRKIPHRMETCGYVVVPNPEADDGIWKISGVRHVLYGKASLTSAARLRAARKFASGR